MESAGVVRTLAEPNLTAISGESATFIAGGEFPIPAGYTCDPTTRVCTTQISFKKFGVSLNFTPVVLTEGRISLRVMTEVSELSNDNSHHAVQAPANTLTIPSIKTRRAETTLEIPSGGSMAMAGLIQEQTKQAINGLPGLMQLPVLGTLFRSRDYVNSQTELMVLVTPYIVRAVAQKDLSRPDDGFADAVRSAGRPARQHQPHLRRSGPRRAGTELSRHLRLHHRLRRDEDEDDDNQTTRSIAVAPSAWRERLSVCAVALGACTHTDDAT